MGNLVWQAAGARIGRAGVLAQRKLPSIVSMPLNARFRWFHPPGPYTGARGAPQRAGSRTLRTAYPPSWLRQVPGRGNWDHLGPRPSIGPSDGPLGRQTLRPRADPAWEEARDRGFLWREAARREALRGGLAGGSLLVHRRSARTLHEQTRGFDRRRSRGNPRTPRNRRGPGGPPSPIPSAKWRAGCWRERPNVQPAGRVGRTSGWQR